MAPPPPFDERRLSSAPDAEVVLHALQGYDAAAREMVRRYERPVYNLIVRIVRDVAAAEDLAQDTFLKIFKSLGTFDPRLRLSAWVLKIAHNTALDHLRRSRVPYLSLDAETDEGTSYADDLADAAAILPDRATERTQLAEALDRALDELRPEYRAALVLRYQEELEYSEVADVLGVPLGTVKTFLYRGRQALARQLASSGWGPTQVDPKPGAGVGRREE